MHNDQLPTILDRGLGIVITARISSIVDKGTISIKIHEYKKAMNDEYAFKIPILDIQ